MKTLKLGLALTALTFSANASAMPPQIPSSWYGLMNFAWSMVAHRPCNDQTDDYGVCGAF